MSRTQREERRDGRVNEGPGGAAGKEPKEEVRVRVHNLDEEPHGDHCGEEKDKVADDRGVDDGERENEGGSAGPTIRQEGLANIADQPV